MAPMAALRMALDRRRNRAERRRDHEALPRVPPGVDARAFVRARALERYGYAVEDRWEAWLHEALGAPWPCPARERFAALWETLERELDGGPEPGTLWDADPAFARAGFCVASHTGARQVVETGVARGITSRCLLEGLGDGGHVSSIDMPPNDPAWAEITGSAVPPELLPRWTYLPGASRRRLPPLLRALGPIDAFVHDSHHTGATMRFELCAAWPRIRPGGVLLCDDVQENAAFGELIGGLRPESWTIAQQERKAALFGVAVKPDAPI